jgi:DNA-directed RNA polymerase specialized sigma24 family protein
MQIRKLDAMIRNKSRDYQRWMEAAECMGGASIGERVQSTRNLHRGSDAIDNYIDAEREIKALKQERQAIIKTIERLPVTEYDLIYRLYVQDQTLKELAYHFGKSYDWVKIKKKRALMLVQAMLDEETALTSTEMG